MPTLPSLEAQQIRDTRLAAIVFFIGLLALLLTAALGLNSWPGEVIFSPLFDLDFRRFIIVFNGYAILLSALFWASSPKLHVQRIVFFAWPVVFALIWASLYDKMTIGWFGGTEFSFVDILCISMGLPALTALLWRTYYQPFDSNPLLEVNFRWLMLLVLLFSLVPGSAVDLTISLHPQTYDIYALKFDAAAKLNFAPLLNNWIDAIPSASQWVMLAYGFTPLAFFALTLTQLKGRAAHVPNALLLWVGMTVCAVVAYQFFPITGPKYVFGSNEYLFQLQKPELLQLTMTSGAGQYPRNGMPSMHFGWMFGVLVVWLLSDSARWSRLLLCIMTFCVALATLYLGEHYVIDLIVAIPFVLAAIALTTTGVPWAARQRWATVLMGFATWLVWVVLLRTQITFFIAQPWACWVLIGATAGVVWWQAYAMGQYRRLADHCAAAALLPELASLPDKAMATRTKRMGLMFFASGAAALVYQVLFAKELALVFGSTATATFTVLATFLGGMAIGSLIGGYVAAWARRPLVLYAMVELAIAGFCVLTPTLFSALQGAYVFLAADLPPDSSGLLVLRIGLGAAVLLVPTVLMGITLPLLVQALDSRRASVGKAVAWLYACNTGGAALGAVLTSYFVIPLLGAHSTTLIAALLNLLVALGALELAKGMQRQSNTEFPQPDQVSPPYTGPAPVHSKRIVFIALMVLGVGGVLSLGLEVVYVHMLSVVAGNSVYAFGLMLATFLVGLAGGGEVGRRLLETNATHRLLWLAVTQIVLATTVALGAWGWDEIPAYFASYAGYPIATSFASREAIRALVCALVMIPPTLCIGMSYTLAMDIATSATSRKAISMVGWAAAVNTLGNITGVVLFGFFLLPTLGGLLAAKLVALGALLLAGIITMMTIATRARTWLYVSLVGAVSLVGLSPTTLDYEMLSSGANVYFVPQSWGRVIDHAESIDGGLTTVTQQQGESDLVTTLLTNGKFQGNDARKGEVQAQIGFAALPLLHQEHRENALVIGYGTGGTSRVFHDAGFAHIDIAELSRDVVALANTHFSKINNQVSGLPGVQTHITDGRNLLLLTKRRYDIISIEITSIWFAGAASLYNQEFYQLARSKLKSDGVLQQWVQLHHMAPIDLLTIISTLRNEFSYVSLYVVSGQGILIATNDVTRSKPSQTVLQALDKAPKLDAVRDLAGRTFSKIAEDLLLSPSEVDAFISRFGLRRDFWISTDNNMRLEYSTPKANANPPDRSFEINLNLLRKVKN